MSVAAAAQWLDLIAPGWAFKVNIGTLDMRSSRNCVLGQLFKGNADYSNGYTYAYHQYPDEVKNLWVGEFCGFPDEWINEIQNRRIRRDSQDIPRDRFLSITNLDELRALQDEYNDREVTVTFKAKDVRAYLDGTIDGSIANALRAAL